MDATCSIQDSIHVFSLVHTYVSRILGTYHFQGRDTITRGTTLVCPRLTTHAFASTDFAAGKVRKTSILLCCNGHARHSLSAKTQSVCSSKALFGDPFLHPIAAYGALCAIPGSLLSLFIAC